MLLIATPGSAGLDISVDRKYVLCLYEGVQLVNTGLKGPLSSGSSRPRIGWRSKYKKIFEVVPGVI